MKSTSKSSIWFQSRSINFRTYVYFLHLMHKIWDTINWPSWSESICYYQQIFRMLKWSLCCSILILHFHFCCSTISIFSPPWPKSTILHFLALQTSNISNRKFGKGIDLKKYPYKMVLKSEYEFLFSFVFSSLPK